MRRRKKDELQIEIEELLEKGGLSNRAKEESLKKKALMIMLSVAAVILIFFVLIYTYIHSCINKMNLVTASEQDTYVKAVIQEDEKEVANLFDDINKELPDSPQEEIVNLKTDIDKNYEKEVINTKADSKVQNILIIGSDAREKGGSGRSDVMMLVSINKKTNRIIVTSILRDIYLQIPGKKNNRINAAYAYGGPELLLETVEKNFKMEVDKYVLIDFYSFIDVVDAVGGLTLEVTKDDISVINGYVEELNRLTGETLQKDLLVEAGSFNLNGKQALGYTRNRYVGNGDFSRTKKQRIVLEQMFQKVKKLNVIELDQLLDEVLPQITTNLTEKELLSLLLALPSFVNYQIDQWSIPVAGSYRDLRIDGMAVLGIDFNNNIDVLYEKVFQ